MTHRQVTIAKYKLFILKNGAVGDGLVNNYPCT